jgi:hypothetical protein
MLGGKSLVVVSQALSTAAVAIEEAIAKSFRIDDKFDVPATRSKTYNLLKALSSDGVEDNVTIADVDAFVEGREECTILAFMVAHVDPRINIVDAAQKLVSGPGGLRSQFDQSNALLSVSSLITQQQSQAPRILAPKTATQASRSIEILSKYRIIAQRSSDSSPPSRRLSSSETEEKTTQPWERPWKPIPKPLNRYATKAAPRVEAVDMDAFMNFVFPPDQLHPRSTGRLLVFSLYGPLTADGVLQAGRAGKRVMSNRELDSMINEIEREDVLAMFTGGSVLCDTKTVEIEVHALSRKLPQMTRAQVDSMLIDLPRDLMGRCSFHDIQSRLIEARKIRIEDGKKMFPALTSADLDPSVLRLRLRDPPVTVGRGTVVQRLGATALAGSFVSSVFSGEHTASGTAAGVASTVVNLASTGTLRPGSKALTSRSKSSSAGSRAKVSGGTMDPRQIFMMTEKVLHRGSAQVISIDDLHQKDVAPKIVSSLRMAREDFTKTEKLSGRISSIPKPAFNTTTAYALHPPPGVFAW